MLEKLLTGLETTIIGICIVFLLLAVLVLSVKLMQLTAGSGSKKPTASIPKQLPAQVPLLPSDTEDEQVVAAITAAVSLMLAQESGRSNVPFVVRRISQIK